MTTYYLDDAATGAGDGSTWADAWTSPNDLGFGDLAAGDILECRPGSGPYYLSVVLTVPGANGTAGNSIIVNGNGVEWSGGIDTNIATYKWTKAAAGTEYYLELSGGGDPSLSQVKCVTVNDRFWIVSAEANHTMGTPGSLSLDWQAGWGDADTLGYSTLYVDIPSGIPSDYPIIAAQLDNCIDTNLAYREFRDLIFSYVNVAHVEPRAVGWDFKRCSFRYADAHAFETSQAGTLGNELNFLLQNCTSYFSGHRFIYHLAKFSEVRVQNCVDYGSHLFALIHSTGDATTLLNMTNSISSHNEAGVIDKVSATAIFTEAGNMFYPRMTAAGGALGYVNAANWTPTHISDIPSLVATTESNQANLTDPLFVATSELGYDKCDFRLTNESVSQLSGIRTWGPATLPNKTAYWNETNFQYK